MGVHGLAPGDLAWVPRPPQHGGAVVSPPQREDRRRRWRRRLAGHAAALVALDLTASALAAGTAYAFRFGDDPGAHAGGYVWFSVTLPLIWVGMLWMARGYDDRFLGFGSEEFQRVFQAFVGLTAVVTFTSYATKAELARGYVVLALPLAATLSMFGHYGARRVLHARRRSGRSLHDVVAVGGELSVVELVRQLRREPYAGLRVIAACLPEGSSGQHLAELDVPVLGGLDDVAAAVAFSGADTVAVTSCAEIDPNRLRRLSWQLEGTETDLVVAPGLMEVAGPRLHIRPVTGLPLLHVEEPDFAGGRRLVKGAVDRIGAAVTLLLLSPVLVVVAVAVRCSGPGPVLFRQTRVGKDGRPFTMVKFRTMVPEAEGLRGDLHDRNDRAEGVLFKMRRDPRVTRVGRVLRRYSLDELPQLFNILSGRMSLVGPRPPLPEEVALYEDDARRRLLVRPGLTGLWQVSGRSDLTWEESVRLDLRYVENWSLALDFMIMWKTAFAVVRGSGAY